MPDPALSFSPAAPQISRKCEACEEEKQRLQMKGLQTPAAAGHNAPASVATALSGPGTAMDTATRAFFEPRFGQDFSQVRLHTDAAAAKSARDVGARAYTAGQNIVFAGGQYDPSSFGGRQLMAHELAHTIQQQHNPAAGIIRRAGRQTRGAGGCASPDQLDEDANGPLAARRTAHIQIQNYVLPRIDNEIPIPRGNILGTVSLTVSGPGGSAGAGAGLSLQTDLLPKGVTLTLSISQSSDKPMLAPSTGDPALPGPRVFGTVGGGSSGGKPAGAATVGFDLPLATDTARPYIYGGVGLRGTADTTGSVAGLGAGIVGLHISPITVQLALDAGIGRAAPGAGGSAAGSTAGTGQASFAAGAEGSVSYKILQHVEITALASVLGGTHMPAAGSLQAGIGGVF